MARNRSRVPRRPRRVPRPARGGMRANAACVLTPGVAATTRRPFGPRRRIGRRPRRVARMRVMQLLDAKLPHLLGLPRAVGPYTTLRTTKFHNSGSNFICFAPVRSEEGWLNVCGFESTSLVLPIASNASTSWIDMPPILGTLSTTDSFCNCVPSKLTVQVMSKGPLSTTNGIFAMGVASQAYKLGGSTSTYQAYGDNFINYFSPRIISLPKLALRGVTASSYPLNMGEYCDFERQIYRGTSPFLWTKAMETNPCALAPIIIYRPDGGDGLDFLITIEWRVRFDPTEAAAATHKHQPTWGDADWDHLCKSASDMGHGVFDIAESIANAGEAVLEAPIAGIAAAA